MGLGPSPLATTATNDVVDWSYVADLQPAPNMMFWPSQFPQLVVYWLKRAPEEEDVANADAREFEIIEQRSALEEQGIEMLVRQRTPTRLSRRGFDFVNRRLRLFSSTGTGTDTYFFGTFF